MVSFVDSVEGHVVTGEQEAQGHGDRDELAEHVHFYYTYVWGEGKKPEECLLYTPGYS